MAYNAAVDTHPDPVEASRRLRAAIAYTDISQTEAAKLLGVSVATLARMLNKKGADGLRQPRWEELWRFADALGLPRAWFTADISRIFEIVPDELPSFPNDRGRRDGALSPTLDEKFAAAQREKDALQREAQRSSLRQRAARDTRRARRSRPDEAS